MNNCYSYAFNDMKNYDSKPQPGDKSGIKRLNSKKYTCEGLEHRILNDYKKSYKLEGDECKDGYYKILLTLDDKGSSRDYHFYKQDTDYWSHKLGTSPISFVDDDGNRIKDPLKADRNYDNKNNESSYNYNKVCGFFCNPL